MAAAAAPIRHLAWELPYAAGVALEKKEKKMRHKKLLLWHKAMGRVTGTLRHRLIPSQAQWVKNPALPQLHCRSRLQLRSDPWPENSICLGVLGGQKRKERKELGSGPWLCGSGAELGQYPQVASVTFSCSHCVPQLA